MKKRKDGRYQKKVTLLNGQTRIVYGRTIAEVNQEADMVRDLERQGLAIGDNTTVGQWAKIWLEKYKSNLRENTIAMYRNAYNVHIMPVLGLMRLRDVRPVHVQDVMNNVKDKSKSLQDKVLLTMKQIFKTAKNNGLIPSVPTEDIKTTPHAKPKQKKNLTPKEQKILMERCASMENRNALLLCGLALYCGWRREELLGVKDTDILGSEITVNRTVTFTENTPAVLDELKTNAAHRTNPIPTELKKILKASGVLEPRERIGFYLISNTGDEPLTKSALRRLWGKITKDLPFKVTLHMLRHSYAKTLYKAGVDLKTAQYLMGHSSIVMTANIYTELEAEDAYQSVSRINKYLANERKKNLKKTG